LILPIPIVKCRREWSCRIHTRASIRCLKMWQFVKWKLFYKMKKFFLRQWSIVWQPQSQIWSACCLRGTSEKF
jgi:hypothetical protein